MLQAWTYFFFVRFCEAHAIITLTFSFIEAELAMALKVGYVADMKFKISQPILETWTYFFYRALAQYAKDDNTKFQLCRS